MIKTGQDTLKQPKAFAVITVRFARRLSEDDLQEIENILRKVERVSSFFPQLRRISFSIGAKDRIDYAVIDKLKKLFKEKLQRNPKITAVEYEVKTRRTF